ncbi:hypothetical protein HFP71_08445 [Streptomyces sp. ARC32]
MAAQEAFTLPLAAMTDRDGRRIDVDRDGTGAPTAVRDSGGRHLHVDTEDDRIVGLRLRNEEAGTGGTTLLRYGYSPDGHLTEVYNSSGLPLRFTYDVQGRITSWTDRNGTWYRFTYDDQDRCIRGDGADGFLSCSIAYDPEGRETRYTDSLGHTTTYRYNERRHVIAQTDPLGNTTYAEWDRYNRLLSRTDPLGHTSRFAYDERGNHMRHPARRYGHHMRVRRLGPSVVDHPANRPPTRLRIRRAGPPGSDRRRQRGRHHLRL